MEMQLAQQIVRERAQDAERHWARRRLLQDRLPASTPHGQGSTPRRQLTLLLGHLLHLRVRRLEETAVEQAAGSRFARVPEGV